MITYTWSIALSVAFTVIIVGALGWWMGYIDFNAFRRRERFYNQLKSHYTENMNAIPSGLVMYLSAFSDASVATPGRWTDMAGHGHNFAFDRGAAGPLSSDPGARGFDLAGCTLVGPQSAALLPVAGQDFTLAWVARDTATETANAPPPVTLFKLRANTPTNNGLQVTMFAPDGEEGSDGKQQIAAAVGSGSAGTWRFPPSTDFTVYALVRQGPALTLYRNGAKVDATNEAGPADDGMLFANPPATINADGAWTGRMSVVALWGRALPTLDVAAFAAHIKSEAGDLPRVRTEAANAQVNVHVSDELPTSVSSADAQARAAVDVASALTLAPTTKRISLRERFIGLTDDQNNEAAMDALALVNGGAEYSTDSADGADGANGADVENVNPTQSV